MMKSNITLVMIDGYIDMQMLHREQIRYNYDAMLQHAFEPK
jgi:hypothetical protein